jgi:hypothetical protein
MDRFTPAARDRGVARARMAKVTMETGALMLQLLKEEEGCRFHSRNEGRFLVSTC